MSKKKLFLFCLLIPLSLSSIEFMKDYLDYSDERPFSPIANDLVYGDGSSEVTSQIDEYQTIRANKPIKGSIFITHDKRNAIDAGSFRLGDKPFKVNFVEATPLTTSSTVEIAIFHFQLPGMPAGTHQLPPIRVKVGGKDIQALPLTIVVLS